MAPRGFHGRREVKGSWPQNEGCRVGGMRWGGGGQGVQVQGTSTNSSSIVILPFVGSDWWRSMPFVDF